MDMVMHQKWRISPFQWMKIQEKRRPIEIPRADFILSKPIKVYILHFQNDDIVRNLSKFKKKTDALLATQPGFTFWDEQFGLIKCIILPPRGLYIPVLPYRFRYVVNAKQKAL